MKKINVIGLAFCALAFSCATETFTYKNPNLGLMMRDTQIIPNEEDGKFYAVGTYRWGETDAEGNAGFPLYVSDNMKDWKLATWIMKQSEIPADDWYRSLFWAPEIHKINGKWYFVYNCDGTQKYDKDLYAAPHGSGISVADKITGPYRALSKKPIAPWPTNDMTLFQDDDGKVYAFFNNGFFNMEKHPESKHSIFVAEVDLEKGELKEEPHKLMTQQDDFESVGIEGSQVVKEDGIYYLFYSGWSNGYAVGYATSKNIYGPYTRAKDNPLFGASNKTEILRKHGKIVKDDTHPFREIGHNQIFKGPDGRYWTSCHAYVKNGDNRFGALLVIDPIEFKDGKIITNTPTWTPQTVDISPDMLKTFPGLAE